MKPKPGDLVTLKSGGPTMTVEHVDGSNVFVSWFVRLPDGVWSDPITSSYKVEALEPAEKEL